MTMMVKVDGPELTVGRMERGKGEEVWRKAVIGEQETNLYFTVLFGSTEDKGGGFELHPLSLCP